MRPFVDARVSRAASALALVIAVATLPGCGLRLFARGPRPAPAPPAAASTAPPAARASEPRSLDREAARQLEADSIAAAEGSLHAALTRDPNDPIALALLSKLDFEQGRHEEAVRLLEPVRAHPEAFAPEARAALLAGLALHEDALGQLDRARADLVSAQATSGDASASAAVYLTLRGESPDSAAGPAKDAVRRDSRSAVNQNNFGITRLRAADPDGARKAFMAAIARDPDLPGPYYNLAILEKFYRLDDAAAAHWYAEYARRSQADPDSLAAVFAKREPRPLAQKGN
ncbi:MAG TPA: tetratricopeptide repeat protein [Candidatus Acidoferrales bacterium]|nr:tetratricopeptide repeat protein [Candidatus Acidoferrales bacterium]